MLWSPAASATPGYVASALLKPPCLCLSVLCCYYVTVLPHEVGTGIPSYCCVLAAGGDVGVLLNDHRSVSGLALSVPSDPTLSLLVREFLALPSMALTGTWLLLSLG